MEKIRVIDSHTAGEPTRVVIEGGPALIADTAPGMLAELRDQHDHWRSAIVNEPRGSDVLVGAWLAPSRVEECVNAVVFFNNVGYLGMCGHGLIGVVRTLDWLGKIGPGEHSFETPVGIVKAVLHDDASISVRNVSSRRLAKDVTVEVPGLGRVSGDVVWGGNTFFLVPAGERVLHVSQATNLTRDSIAIMEAVRAAGYPDVDHVEFFGPPASGGDARNFVLCPGGAYDRSPCGTGTSAKLACLAADGDLEEGETWIQESILGTKFQGSFTWQDRESGSIRPVVTGRAHVTADSILILEAEDPLRCGIRPGALD
ncbi:MAG: proline racemase family protein [Verrucomicrobiales bacterium]